MPAQNPFLSFLSYVIVRHFTFHLSYTRQSVNLIKVSITLSCLFCIFLIHTIFAYDLDELFKHK